MVKRPQIAIVSRFFRWWGRELAQLWPFGRERADHRRRAIVVSPGLDGLDVYDVRDGRTLSGAGLEERVQDAESALIGLARQTGARAPIVLRLPADRVFVRTLTLPTAALADAARIADLELEHETPFRLADMATAVVRAPSGSQARAGHHDVLHLVVKHAAITDGERLLSRYGLAPDRIDAWQPAMPGAAPIAYDVDFRASRAAVPPVEGIGLAWTLAASALALTAITAAIVVVRLDATLSEAEAATAAARADLMVAQAADAGRAAAATIVRDVKAARAAEIDRIRILATLTRLIPDDDHLVALKVSGDGLEATGYARSATELVLAMERSDLFAKVSLTSAVTYDDRLNRERYALRAEIDRKVPPPLNGGER